MGPDPGKLREIARSVEEIMRNDPNMRTVNVDWGERVPKLHFVLDQERLQLIGLSPEAAAQQLQFLLNGQTITQVQLRDTGFLAMLLSLALSTYVKRKVNPKPMRWKL